ncbi:MAG: hypothetical protein CM15mV22_1900 [Eurybiavirus sp.]|nr:MAG: hypothetical protein CM15mV22_1900 [Eurybiavirus sp.]
MINALLSFVAPVGFIDVDLSLYHVQSHHQVQSLGMLPDIHQCNDNSISTCATPRAAETVKNGVSGCLPLLPPFANVAESEPTVAT